MIAAPPCAPVSSSRPRNADRSGRVLCADPHVSSHRLLRLFLEHAGYSALSATDHDDAWDLLNAHEFDVLVCAHELPGRTEPNFAWDLRKAGLTLPLVLTYGSLDRIDHDELRALHVVAVLLKPFSQVQLAAEVSRALAYHARNPACFDPARRQAGRTTLAGPRTTL